jgi:glycosyltransferase involved in cell wall biosynthesis
MSDPESLRVAVLQPGARLHYAVPTILQRAGMLQRFYTDFCANVGPLRYLESIWPAKLQSAPVRRMLGRKLPAEIPPSKVCQVRAAVAREQISRLYCGGRAARSASASMIELARKEQLGGANAVYTVLVNEDLEFCREARERGCRIIHEAMLSPDIGLWLNEEQRRFPGLSRNPRSIEQIEDGRQRDRLKHAVADLIVVPSDFVRQAVLDLGAGASRIAVVPYGIERRWFQGKAETVKGRALFVGSVNLLKGSHYLADAARLLARRKVSCDVRVVGPFAADTIRDPLFSGPTYIGQIPRAEVHKEFLAADVLVLPTLCDSFALVQLEAMACGVPVIATSNCGVVVRDGIDGIIVPVRSGAALADAIERIITDRNSRETMSKNAREQAAAFSWERYEERLVSALLKLQPSPSTA